jgi:hypothetical protein
MSHTSANTSLKISADEDFHDDSLGKKHIPRRQDSGGTHTHVDGVNASIIRAKHSRTQVEESASHTGVFFPWNKKYKTWWAFTVAATFCTAFYEPYMCAFGDGGKVAGGAAVLGYLLIAVFLIDMVVNCNLAYYDEMDEIIWDRRLIVKHYWKSGMLLIDFLGVFPFYIVALAVAGETGNDNNLTQYLNLFRLIRIVRLYRVKQLYNTVRFSTQVSFMALTMSRNFLAGILWTHWNACIFYFIARQHNFNDNNTWIGGSIEGSNRFERYITSLYWSITSTLWYSEKVLLEGFALHVFVVILNDFFLYAFLSDSFHHGWLW